MTKDQLIEKLARAACVADDDGGPDEIVYEQPWWRQYEEDARRFLAMMEAYEEVKSDPWYGDPCPGDA